MRRSLTHTRFTRLRAARAHLCRIGHLMGVASIVLDDGGTEDEAIAALLHDAPEDQGGRERLDDIRGRFGDQVAKIVEDCTDSWSTPKEPMGGTQASLCPACADAGSFEFAGVRSRQVHNAYAILRDLRNSGEQVWSRFSASQTMSSRTYQALVRRLSAMPEAENSSTSSNGSSAASSAKWVIDLPPGSARRPQVLRAAGCTGSEVHEHLAAMLHLAIREPAWPPQWPRLRQPVEQRKNALAFAFFEANDHEDDSNRQA